MRSLMQRNFYTSPKNFVKQQPEKMKKMMLLSKNWLYPKFEIDHSLQNPIDQPAADQSQMVALRDLDQLTPTNPALTAWTDHDPSHLIFKALHVMLKKKRLVNYCYGVFYVECCLKISTNIPKILYQFTTKIVFLTVGQNYVIE